MTFKKFSSEQDASRAKPDNKAKAGPAINQAATQPDKKPAETAPASKS